MELLSYLDMLRLYLTARMGVAERDQTGSVTLEQVIITAVLSAAAIAAGVAIVAAIVNHQGNIK